MLSNKTLAAVDAAKAAKLPPAGSGAGAFMCEGTWTGSRAKKAASPALPRIRRAAAVTGQDYAQAGSAGRAYPGSFGPASLALTGTVGNGSGLTGATQQHVFETTRIPMIPGVLGSHPAREPDPV